MSQPQSAVLDRLAHPWIDRWLPAQAESSESPGDVLRRRIVSALLQALALLAFAFGIFDVVSGLYGLAATLFGGLPLAFGSLIRMRAGATMKEIGFTASGTLFVVVVANACLNGGLQGASLLFLPLVPTLALLMDAPRLGRVWVGICFATLAFLFVLEGPGGLALPQTMPAAMLPQNLVMVQMAMGLMVYGAFLLNIEFGRWMQLRLLEAEAERLDRILDAAGDAILRLDEHGAVSTANAAAMRLFGATQLSGSGIRDLLIGFDRLETARGAVELMAKSAGTSIPVEATCTHLGDGQVLVIRDIRERVQAQEELERARDEAQAANVAKSRFLASMSHELRTPLNAVIGYAEMMGEDITRGSPPTDDTDVQHITGAARHLLALIDQVLDLARVESGRVEVEPREVALGALLEELDTVGSTLARGSSNRWITSFPEELPTLLLDEVRVRQIVLNLLSNAAKFCENGEIHLEVSLDAEYLCFAVSDTGIGMSPSELDAVWEEFVQAEKSTSRVYGGTGLGLPLSRKLAHLLGGALEATSEKGTGSRFVVTLPRLHAP